MPRHDMKPRLLALGCACAMAAWVAAAGTQAQGYPAKPVRLIAPFAPGGPTDIVACVVSQRLGQQLGQTVVVDNRASAGGAIGCEIVANTPGEFAACIKHETQKW